MARQPRKTTTGSEVSIVDGVLYFEDVRQCSLVDENASEILEDKYLKSIRLVSLAQDWYQHVWIPEVGYVKEDLNVEMTLRKEKRGLASHWYAYRRVLGTLHKRYVGQSEKITPQRLIEIAKKMPSR